YPPPYAGPELGMKLFLESELRNVFHVHFLQTNIRKSDKDRFKFQSIKFIFIFLGKLVYHLIRHRPDLVYYPVTATRIGWIGRDIWCLVIAKLFMIPTVIHLRAGHLKLNFKTFHPVVKNLVKYVCSSVALALVQAECLRDQFSGLVPDNRIKILYNAVDTSEYVNMDLEDYDPNIILYMGIMTKAKGYCDAVRAIPIVAKRYPDIKFCFAGRLIKGQTNVFFDQTNGIPFKYEDPFQVHDEISSGPYRDNYLYLGVISGLEKMEHLRATNLFILPSYSEGFSLAALEAMSMGKPIIYTPVGALKEVLIDGENGLMINPGDCHELAERIIQILTDHELRNHIAHTNYRLVRENFDVSLVSSQLKNYFCLVLNHGG
ncbi:MAG: glycosyltransferase family 4 protein, partial [Candidatus Helarchaeota archaeon]